LTHATGMKAEYDVDFSVMKSTVDEVGKYARL
jgi:hypothetical protein